MNRGQLAKLGIGQQYMGRTHSSRRILFAFLQTQKRKKLPYAKRLQTTSAALTTYSRGLGGWGTEIIKMFLS